MALNFPDSPTLNQVYTDTVSGFSYQWDGVVWQSYTPSASKNINIVDAIEGSFNGSTQTFGLAVSGIALYPANAQQLIVVLGGIVQEPGVDYTISGSNITFTTAPASGLSLSIVSIGPAVPINTVVDGSVTPAKLSTGGPSWNTAGGLNVTGIATVNSLSIGSTQVISSARQLQNITSLDATTTATIESAVSAAPNDFSSLYVSGISTLGYSSGVGTVRIGSGSTALIVEGDTRVTGVITASSFVGNFIGNVTGTASTASFATTSFGLSGTPDITVRNVIGVAATFTGNVSIAGTLTYEDVTNVDSVGLITARSGVNVTSGSVVVGSAVTLNSSGINVVGVVTSTSAVVGSAVTINSTGITGVLANYSERINVLGNTGTASTINLSNGNFVTATLTGDCTFTFTTGIGTGTQAFTLFLTNDATPNRVITWPVTVKWPNATTPVRTTTANKTDVYSFFTFDNGTNWYGTLSIYNYS